MDIKELKEMRKKLAALSVAGTMAISTVGFATGEVYADDTITDDITTSQEKDVSYASDKTTDKNEVENWLNEKENELKDDYDITQKEIIELENQVISTEEVEVNEVFDTEIEAKNKKDEIEKGDIEKAELSIIKNEAVIDVVNEVFDTEEDALKFAKEYKEKYNSDLSVSEIYSDWVSNGIVKVKEFSGLTEEERNKEVERIIKEIENSESDVIRYEISVTKTSNTEKVYIKDNVTKEVKVFDSLEAANEFISDLKLSENDNVKIEISGPTLESVYQGTDVSTVKQIFDSEEDLNNYLTSLEDEGYVLSNINKEEEVVKNKVNVPTGNIIVNNSNKLNSNSRYEVDGNYIMIKQASGNVAIWTKEPLTANEQNSFKNSWFQGNYDPSVGRDVNIYFISGEGVKDLSYIGNAWGQYNITIDNNKIIMTCDKQRISHLNYGKYEQEYKEEIKEETKYVVTLDKSIDKYIDKYAVDYQKTEKIYEDVTKYGAIVNKEEFTRDKNYQVSGECELEKETWILSGNYIKNNRGSLFYGIISGSAKELVDEKDDPVDEKSLNESSPQTGDDRDLSIPLALAGASLLAAGALGRTRKRI